MLSISFTLCCVGLVFSSPAAAMKGTRVTCTKRVFSVPSSRRIWRMASRKGSDSMSPTVPPISTMTTRSATSNRFPSSKPSDVADRAANLHDDDVHAVGNFLDDGLDFVGDVRDDLNGLAEVIAAALFGENGFVDAAGGPVIVAGKFGVGEALVVAEIEVGFGAVFGDKDFAVLKGAHRTGIHVQVRIAFLQGDFETATFEETTNRGGCYAFSQ